jgi:hypothetical protein
MRSLSAAAVGKLHSIVEANEMKSFINLWVLKICEFEMKSYGKLIFVSSLCFRGKPSMHANRKNPRNQFFFDFFSPLMSNYAENNLNDSKKRELRELRID